MERRHDAVSRTVGSGGVKFMPPNCKSSFSHAHMLLLGHTCSLIQEATSKTALSSVLIETLDT